MAKDARSSYIRRDIFSVKADERDGADWTHVYMTTERELARLKAREIRANTSLGLNRLAVVVHPAQWVVEAFLAAGNVIHNKPLGGPEV